LGEDPADLLHVVGVVAGHVRGQLPDGDWAALDVDAAAFPLFRRKVLEKPHSGIAEKAEEFQ